MERREPEGRRNVREPRGRVSPRPDYGHKRIREGCRDAAHEEAESESTEERWLWAASNSAFAFLDEPEEDVYTLEDGEPFGEDWS